MSVPTWWSIVLNFFEGWLDWDFSIPTPEAKLALPEDLETPRAAVLEKTIVLFHDESTFRANDFERTHEGRSHAGAEEQRCRHYGV